MKPKFFTQKKLSYSFVVVFLAAYSFLRAQIVQSQTHPRYNVLFIVVDDMNDHIGFMGSSEVKTPNMKRLLAHGMLFTQVYVQYPLCNPSRTSFLSGWRPDHTGVFSNSIRPSTVISSNVKYLPTYFKQFGYDIERYGKIMHSRFENDITWDFAEPAEKESTDEITSTSTSGPFPPGTWWVRNNTDPIYGDERMTNDLVARLQQTQAQPFFYGLGFITPHDPFTPNLEYWNKIGDPSVQELLPQNVSGTTSPGFKGNGSENIKLPTTPPNDRNDVPSIAFSHVQTIKPPDDWRRAIHAYDADVAETDGQLGLVLDELDRQNLWANTIVVFFGDHGQHLGEHEGLWKKNTLFEESLHIPFIICAPGKQTGGVCSKLIEIEDVYPTLLELCSLPPVSKIEGSSFAPLLSDPTLSWKTAAFSQVERIVSGGTLMGRSVRTKQYRYTSWSTYGEELYDHDADPHEYTNLITNSAYAAVLKNMRTVLKNGWTKASPPSRDSLKYYEDKDGDGFGNPSKSIISCYSPTGYVTNNGDCNDNNALIYPPDATITPLGNLDICTTGSVVLEANNSSGFTYQWKKDDAPIPNETRRKYTATAIGTYKVVVTDSSDCSRTSQGVVATNSCNLISSNTKNSLVELSNKLSLYPNPSNGNITVIYHSSTTGKVSFKIYDVRGKIVFNSTNVTVVKGSNAKTLNLSNLAGGTYYFSLNNNQAATLTSFIIIK